MSRRSHHRSHKGGRPAHPGLPAEPARQPGNAPGEPATAPHPAVPVSPASVPSNPASPAAPAAAGGQVGMPAVEAVHGPTPPSGYRRRSGNGHAPNGDPRESSTTAAADVAASGGPVLAGPSLSSSCTAPQLRRFIKSRSWVPMHELRRRFAINGPEDDVTSVTVNGLTIYLGLPPREGRLLGELLQAGDIGYELSLDPATPVVIGVYPMRPVPRH